MKLVCLPVFGMSEHQQEFAKKDEFERLDGNLEEESESAAAGEQTEDEEAIKWPKHKAVTHQRSRLCW